MNDPTARRFPAHTAGDWIVWRNRWWATLMAGLILTVAPGAAPAEEPNLHINVRIYDYAEIPKGTLERALDETTRIFRRAGVKMSWLPCPLVAERLDEYPECNRRQKPTDLIMRILPREMAVRLAMDHNACGIAASVEKGGFGSHAGVFYHKVEEAAEWWDTPKSLLLGHLMAHEMGHLLLGSNSHSRSGIMHVQWNKEQLQRLQTATLLFTPDEAERIQEHVRKRMETAIASLRPVAIEAAGRAAGAGRAFPQVLAE